MFSKRLLILFLFSALSFVPGCRWQRAFWLDEPSVARGQPTAYDPASATARVFGSIRFEERRP